MFYPSYRSCISFGLIACFSALYLIDHDTMEEEKFAIRVEWFDDISSLVRSYTLFYFPTDRSVEMYDTSQKRTFLKRSICNTISESDLYIGNIVTVFGRKLKLIEYLNEVTSNSLQKKAERTYAMLKPEVVQNHLGKILSFIENKGFSFNKLMLTKLNAKSVAEFYKEHQGKAFYEKLINYISSGPVVAMELLAPFAIQRWRNVLGPTDPAVARSSAPDSLRSHFGTDTTYNAAHGSDSPEAAQREISLIFSNQQEFLEPSRPQTLCLIKPHIVQEGKLGALITLIQEGGYKITGLKLHRLSQVDVEHFFVAYKGVWEDYMAHVKHFSSGPMVAVSIASDVDSFREFVGPFDPDVARKLHSSSIRARFGHDITHNAVHCTDLSTDGNREVEFFFNITDSKY